MADEIKTDEITQPNPENEESISNKKEEAVSLAAVKKAKNSIEAIERSFMSLHQNVEKYPLFNVGDTVKVFVKIIEGEKTKDPALRRRCTRNQTWRRPEEFYCQKDQLWSRYRKGFPVLFDLHR